MENIWFKDFGTARAPLIQYLAERAEIKWETKENGEKLGIFFVDGEKIHLLCDNLLPFTDIYQPSYYFTHGRVGTCVISSLANVVILRAMGYDARDISAVDDSGQGHAWNEVFIDGEIYAVDFNLIKQRESYYEQVGYNEKWPNWTMNTWEYHWQSPLCDYDPDWYKK